MGQFLTDINNLSSQTYLGGLLVGYAPDALGRPTQVGTFASGVTYYPSGAISGFTYGNGFVHTMTPNARQLPARSVDAYGATKALDDSYTYDANGNVMSLADAVGTGLNDRSWGVVAGAPTVYDGLDRLTRVRGANWGTLTGNYNALYTYDPLDNIRSSKLGLAGYVHAYDLGSGSGNTNRLLSMAYNGGAPAAFVTDAAGNITSDARRAQSYQFDIAHRINAVTGKESYLYDGNGRRARTLNSTSGAVDYFAYGQDGRLLQDSSTRRGVRTGYVYLGNSLVGQYEVNLSTSAAVSRYKHTDALGSPVVTTDAARTITGRQLYTPYGSPLGTVDGVGYTGHVMDMATGLTYMQQRYYDPQIGRLINVDPMASDTTTGWNFNRYNYAANNPYKFTDPDGRIINFIIGAGIGAGLDIVAQKIADPGGKINWTSVAVSGLAGSLTGGIGGGLTKLAAARAISTTTAVAGTAATGGVVGGSVANIQEMNKGGSPSLQTTMIGAAIGTLTAGAGAAASNTGQAMSLSRMAAAPVNSPAGIGTHIVQQTTQVTGSSSATTQALGSVTTGIATETAGKIIEKAIE